MFLSDVALFGSFFLEIGMGMEGTGYRQLSCNTISLGEMFRLQRDFDGVG
jgi:hypothetical protein